MSTTYPGAIDNLTNPSSTDDTVTLSHANQHANANDAIEALETQIGITSSADTGSIVYKLTNSSSSNPGHKHTLAQGATDVTASAAELNILDGVTASAAELNVLDGIPGTLTATELGYVDGVTSAIQTQINTKAPTASPSFTGDVGLATSANIQVNGADPKRSMYIPASALFPATTSGCAALAQGETTTNKINYKYLAFDQSTEEYAWFHCPTPDYWDLGTITIVFHWTASSGSGDVIWGAAGLCRSNDDALDTALGTAQTVTDTLIATGDEHTTSATSAITIGGTPAKGDKLYLRVYRDADAGGDTLSGDALLTGITIKFGIGQYDDQ